MKFLKKYIHVINTINNRVGIAVSWTTSLLVLIVCYDVFTRYFLKKSIVAVQELEWHLFAIIFLLGAASTLLQDRHVRVDVFYSNFSKKKKAWIDLTGSILFLIPFSLLVIWSSKNFILLSLKIKETSPDPGGLPARYLLKMVIPLAFLLVLFQAFAFVFNSLLTVMESNPESKEIK